MIRIGVLLIALLATSSAVAQQQNPADVRAAAELGSQVGMLVLHGQKLQDQNAALRDQITGLQDQLTKAQERLKNIEGAGAR